MLRRAISWVKNQFWPKTGERQPLKSDLDQPKSAQPINPFEMDHVSDDVVQHIFVKLDNESMAKIAQVSKRFNSIVKETPTYIEVPIYKQRQKEVSQDISSDEIAIEITENEENKIEKELVYKEITGSYGTIRSYLKRNVANERKIKAIDPTLARKVIQSENPVICISIVSGIALMVSGTAITNVVKPFGLGLLALGLFTTVTPLSTLASCDFYRNKREKEITKLRETAATENTQQLALPDSRPAPSLAFSR